MSEFYKKLLEMRDGCRCQHPNGSPPCSACTNPITEDEVEELFEYSENLYLDAMDIRNKVRVQHEDELFKFYCALVPAAQDSFLHRETFKLLIKEIRS